MLDSLGRLKRAVREHAPRLSPAHRRRRRFNLQDQASPAWQLRAEQAVELWIRNRAGLQPEDPANRPISVADLGCGNERLRHVLASRLGDRVKYQGFDVQPQLPTTVRLDLRRELPDRSFDLVIALGLLEYLRDLPSFLARLRAVCSQILVSYAISDCPDPLSERERDARGWLSHYSRAGFTTACEGAGWVVTDFELLDEGRTGLWLWQSPSSDT